MKAIVDFIDERSGLRSALAWLGGLKLPGGARPRYVFGSVLVYLFLQQAFLGVLLASYYSPSATDAWASTAYLNDQVTAGWFLRGLHHHGSSAMVVLTVLHFLQTVIAGAYRKPRELNWLTGLAMAGVVFAFALTGYLLPWDQKGYWATQVAMGILGSMPGGQALRTLIQGGAVCGNLTLTRFFTLHVFILPFALATLLVFHVALFRRHGVTPPPLPERELESKSQIYFPSQLLWDVAAMALTAAALVLVTFETHGSPLFAPAQPASNFVARPEWYFLTPFQLLKYFEGPLQVVATVIIPGAVTTFLVALPWIDRASSARAGERMPVLSVVALLMAGVATLTSMALVEDAKDGKFQKGLVVAHKEASRARELAKAGVLPAGGDAVFLNDPRVRVRSLFKEHCETCHTLDGEGGEEAPDLTHYKSREWFAGVIRNPRAKRFFGGTKTHKEMDAYPPSQLSDDKLKALVEYMTSLMGEEAGPVDAALVARGQKLFADDLDCNTCHEVKPGEVADGPNLAGDGSRAWTQRVIENSAAEDLFGKVAAMPKFGKKLTDEQIRELADFIASQRTDGGHG